MAKKRPKKTVDDDESDSDPAQRASRSTKPSRIGPLVMLMIGGYCVLSLAIVVNATMFQPVLQKRASLASNQERPDLVPTTPGQNTIVIRYDPVVEDVQRELLATGGYAGQVDGIYGDKTRIAVLAYQRANELETNGKVTPALLDHIRYRRTLEDAAKFTGSTEFAPTDKSGPARDANSLLLKVEQALADLGYDTGTVDGRMTREFEAAIRKFQADENLPVTGKLDVTMVTELAKTTGYEDLVP